MSLVQSVLNSHSNDQLAGFLDADVCECVLAALNAHAYNPEICAYGCTIVADLSAASRDLSEHMGEIGLCETVVYVTEIHIGDAAMAEAGSGAIGMLAKDNISNSYALSQAGACDVLSQTGNFGFNIRHPLGGVVAARVCWAFALLSEAANCRKLIDSGACDLVSQLLRFYYKDREDVASNGIKAICCLASLCFDTRQLLGRAGSCVYVVETMKLYDNINVQQDCCESIMHLTLNPDNADILGSCGACEVVTAALAERLMDNFLGAEVCTGALLNLITYGTRVKENKAKMIAAGLVEVLRRVQLSTRASYRARENVLQLLEGLGAEQVGGSTHSLKPGNDGFVGVVNASEAIDGTIPLACEIREYSTDEISDDALLVAEGVGGGICEI